MKNKMLREGTSLPPVLAQLFTPSERGKLRLEKTFSRPTYMRSLFFLFVLIAISGCTDDEKDISREEVKQANGVVSENILSNAEPSYFNCTSTAKYLQFEHNSPVLLKIHNNKITTFDYYSRKAFRLGSRKSSSHNLYAVKTVSQTSFHPFIHAEGGEIPEFLLEEHISHGVSITSSDLEVGIVGIEFATQNLRCRKIDGKAANQQVESLDSFFNSVVEDAERLKKGNEFSFTESEWWPVAILLYQSKLSGACGSFAEIILDAATDSYSVAQQIYAQSASQINRLGCIETAFTEIESQTIYELNERVATTVNSILNLQPYKPKIVSVFGRFASAARYDQRHPKETLQFFGIEPGMTVVEALPGGGWYSRILLPYLGSEGRLIGANYALEMWPLFSFGTEAFMLEMRRWQEQFAAQADQWCADDCASVDSFWLGSLSDEMAGTADAVMFIRALHNLARFNEEHGYLDAAVADAFEVLKSGGTFGVVQHWAREDMPDEWADGSNGYLKKEFVIGQAEAAGFEFVAESDANANPNDQPSADEAVWRLPPSLRLPEDAENPDALRAKYEAVGESHRMTLKFRKP